MSSPLTSDDVVMELRTLPEVLRFFARQWSPRILVFATTSFLVARAVTGPWSLWDLVVALAVAASWHLQERLLHEYLLHWKARPFVSRAVLKLVSQHHRRHHRDPWRTQTLFITTAAYAFTIPAVVGVLLLLTRNISLTLTGSFAYFLTLLCYEWAHCLIHSSYSPRSTWYRRRWWNHRLHHFKNSSYWYGITSPLWDTLLHSRPDPSGIITRKDWRGPDPLG